MSLQYAGLNISRSEIRVLQPKHHAAHRDHSKAIECETPLAFDLRIVSIDERPKFVAVSYVWGDPTKTKPIEVDGIEVQVTLNLHNVLHWHFHAKNQALPVWADAICINQVDLDEKSHQIQLMSSIYENATKTICWLGPSSPQIEDYIRWEPRFLQDGSDLVEKLRDFIPQGSSYNTRLRYFQSLSWLSLRIRSVFSKRAKGEHLLRAIRVVFGRVDLLSLEYFQRMWTAQECIIPKNKAIFVLDGEVSKINLYMMGRKLDNSLWKLSDGLKNAQDIRSRSPAGEKIALATAKELRSPIFTKFPHHRTLRRAWYAIRFSIKNGESRGFDLYELMIATSIRTCEDPRDRVFALLSLLRADMDSTEAQTNLLKVDYHKTQEQVFLDALYYIYTEESPADMNAVLECFMPRCTLPKTSADGRLEVHSSNETRETPTPPSAHSTTPSWLTNFAEFDKRERFKLSGKVHEEFRAVRDRQALAPMEWTRLDLRDQYSADRLVFQGNIVGSVRLTIRFPESNLSIIQLVRKLLNAVEARQNEIFGDSLTIMGPSIPNIRSEVEEFVSAMVLVEDSVRDLSKCLRDFDMRTLCGLGDTEFWDKLYQDVTASQMLTTKEKKDPAEPEGAGQSLWDEAQFHIRRSERAPEMLKGHALFLLENGTFGLCMATVEKGDIIVMSPHFSKCLALHPGSFQCRGGGGGMGYRTRAVETDEGHHSKGRVYHLVDWAYVGGLSDISHSEELLQSTMSQPWEEIVLA